MPEAMEHWHDSDNDNDKDVSIENVHDDSFISEVEPGAETGSEFFPTPHKPN